MDTRQIDTALRRSRISNYTGVFACDQVPIALRGTAVVNLDEKRKPGSHWIAIWISEDGKRGEYFDTFGRKPKGLLETYMNENCTTWTCNNKQIQSVISRVCGVYCILYCIFRSRGCDILKFVSLFTKDTALNDLIACKLLRKLGLVMSKK